MPGSSNQREFFFSVRSFYEYVQSNRSNTRDRKNFVTRANFFLQCSCLFLRAFVSNKESIMTLCLKQYGDPWAAKTFFWLFSLYFRRKMRLQSGGRLFFGQQILLAENVVKDPAQNKFSPTYWYHLSLVTKNMIKVYKKMVGDFTRFLQI